MDKNLLFIFIFYKMYIDYNEKFIYQKKRINKKNKNLIIYI
jgi:hypothetical protein